jgi:hypothetical protein
MEHPSVGAYQRNVGWTVNLWAGERKASVRFLKKAAQKLLLCWAMGNVSDNAHGPA